MAARRRQQAPTQRALVESDAFVEPSVVRGRGRTKGLVVSEETGQQETHADDRAVPQGRDRQTDSHNPGE